MTDFEKLFQAVQLCSLELVSPDGFIPEFEIYNTHVSMITLQAYPTKAIAIVKTKAIARKIQQYYDGCFTIDFEWHMQDKVCYDMLMITSSPAPLLTRFHTSYTLDLN